MKTAINILKWVGVLVILLISILCAPEMEAHAIDDEYQIRSGISMLIMASLAMAAVAILIRLLIKKYFDS